MKTKKKILTVLAIVGCAILLVAGSIAGTVAYLTATDSVTNTFTVGNVSITLNESKLNDDGVTVDTATKVKANTYHLLPGTTYEKDPTVHLGASSEPCWLFVDVKNEISAIEVAAADGDTIHEQLVANGWVKLAGSDTVYYYGQIVKPGADNDYELFSSVTIASTVTNETLDDYEGKTVAVTAYAIQSAGFETVGEAWTAVRAAYPNP